MGLAVPATERQSVSTGELRGVLHALQRRRAGEKMAVVLDSEYVYKGITEWSPKWHRHSWRVKSREVGHRDLWEAIFQLRQDAGPCLSSSGSPHTCAWGGNDKAGALAEFGREMHPNNKKRKGDGDRMPRLWRDAGLSPMRTDVLSSES